MSEKDSKIVEETYDLPMVRVQLVMEPVSDFTSREPIATPEDAVNAVAEYLQKVDREYLVAIFIATDGHLICAQVVSIGTLNYSAISGRELYKAAVLSNCSSVILLHNHPSGNLTPSDEDIKVTRDLEKGGRLLGIQLLDHIIVAGGCAGQLYSFLRNGKMSESC